MAASLHSLGARSAPTSKARTVTGGDAPRMRGDGLRRLTPLLLGAMPWLAAPAATGQHAHGPAFAEPAPREQRLRVDTRGEVRLTFETRVGELRLKPGRYRVEHRVAGAHHFVYFAASSEGERSPRGGSRGTEPQAGRLRSSAG